MKSNSYFKQIFSAIKLPLIAVFIALLIGGILIMISGFNPIEAIFKMFKGGFGNFYYISMTITRATPIIFAGLAGALAWGSGYPSLGAAGQMVFGAFISSIVAINFPGPTYIVVIASLISGMLSGMLYSLLATWISKTFQLYLLIITLMLNYIADFVTSYFTMYIFKDPFGADASAIQTQKIIDIIPRMSDKYTLHYGTVIAIITVVIVLFIVKRTSFGYKAKIGGLNPKFADYGGINSTKMMYFVLMLSGAIAGLGGAVEVLGNRYRFIDGMLTSAGYAWTGIIASLMSSNNPIGILFSSIFLAGLTTGGGSIERSMGVPSEITIIIQGIITLFITARFSMKFLNSRKDGGEFGN